MQKKTLRWIMLVIVAVVALVQYFSESPETEPIPAEPAPATVAQAEKTESSLPATEVLQTESPATEETPIVVQTETVFLPEPTGGFDFFVLALSWSPDYCASAGSNDPEQCSIGKKLDFVLHGLWPQYNNGYPSYCSTETLSDALKDEYPGLYPSETLYGHEWEKHGTCTGLQPEEYLEWSQELKDVVIIPPAYDSPAEPFRTDSDGLKAAFMQVNPAFEDASFAVYCSGSGRFLKELFVCFSKDGSPIDCGSNLHKQAAKSCGQDDFLVRNTR